MSNTFEDFTKDKEKVSLAIANLLNDFIMKYPVTNIKVETKSKKTLGGSVVISGLEIKVEI